MSKASYDRNRAISELVADCEILANDHDSDAVERVVYQNIGDILTENGPAGLDDVVIAFRDNTSLELLSDELHEFAANLREFRRNCWSVV